MNIIFCDVCLCLLCFVREIDLYWQRGRYTEFCDRRIIYSVMFCIESAEYLGIATTFPGISNLAEKGLISHAKDS